jgi:hypothetical protein
VNFNPGRATIPLKPTALGLLTTALAKPFVHLVVVLLVSANAPPYKASVPHRNGPFQSTIICAKEYVNVVGRYQVIKVDDTGGWQCRGATHRDGFSLSVGFTQIVNAAGPAVRDWVQALRLHIFTLFGTANGAASPAHTIKGLAASSQKDVFGPSTLQVGGQAGKESHSQTLVIMLTLVEGGWCDT